MTIFGYGLPRWRGCLTRYADTIGPATALERLKALSADDPLVWKPSRVIEDCATRAIALKDWSR